MKSITQRVCFFLLVSTAPLLAQNKDYLTYVQQHCDNLIRYGKDRYGAKETYMLASVIDTRDMSIPKADVPPTEGTRVHDRAVGGSNFYHDVETIALFHALSELTSDAKYKAAATAYTRDFLAYCQNLHTGLLAWGEHLYYNFYADSVMVGDLENPRQELYHEFLAQLPPWPLLWETDTAATAKAIAGIQYHFRSPVTQSFLFNRHAYWQKVDKEEYRGLAQYQDGGQPWIKHSGLQCYSFTFLYEKTRNPIWQRWAEGAGSLYWNYRNPDTHLTLSCIDDPRPNSMRASLSSMAQLSYYLLKAWQLHPEWSHFKERAEVMLTSAEKFSWDEERKGYYTSLNLDGSVFDDTLIPVIYTGYGSSSIIAFGRIAAHFYQVTGDTVYQIMVRKVADMLKEQQWPEDFVVNSLAEALQFTLDAYEVLDDQSFLKEAHRFAEMGIQKLWSGKLFVRKPDDPFYEAKLETSSLVLGLLRLHTIENAHKD